MKSKMQEYIDSYLDEREKELFYCFDDRIEYVVRQKFKKALLNKPLTIKTQFGTSVGVIPSSNESDVITYIMYKLMKLNLYGNIENTLSTQDIGLIVKNKIIYANIDSEVASWIYNNGDDKYLYELACGYKVSLDEYNPIEYLEKYIRLIKNYNLKSKMMQDEQELRDKLSSSNTFILPNGDKVIYNDAVRHLHELYLYNNGKACKKLNLYDFKRFYTNSLFTTKDIFEFEQDNYTHGHSDLYHNELLVQDTFKISLESKHHSGLNYLAKIAIQLNISFIMLYIRLITNVNIIDAIKIGIQERDSKGLTYGMLGNLHQLDSEYTTKGIIDRIIKDKIKEEKENNNNG